MFDTTNQYELSLVINGNPLTEYYHNGNFFVEGRTNSNYELRVKNNSPERIMAILSVDGLGVIDGKSAGADSPGYIVDPWQTLTIPGWKVDGDTAAKFQFGSASGSYANRTGRTKKNVGVIGLMVFRPKYVPPVNFYPTATFTFNDQTSSGRGWNPTLGGTMSINSVYGSSLDCDSIDGVAMAAPSGGVGGITGSLTSNNMMATASNAIPKSPVSQNLGTEYGDATSFQTTQTTFDKRDPAYPDALLAIYYDDAHGLEARGIMLPYRNSSPQAFPTYTSSNTSNGFASPPPGWTRK